MAFSRSGSRNQHVDRVHLARSRNASRASQRPPAHLVPAPGHYDPEPLADESSVKSFTQSTRDQDNRVFAGMQPSIIAEQAPGPGAYFLVGDDARRRNLSTKKTIEAHELAKADTGRNAAGEGQDTRRKFLVLDKDKSGELSYEVCARSILCGVRPSCVFPLPDFLLAIACLCFESPSLYWLAFSSRPHLCSWHRS